MSGPLAIAATTATLRDILQVGMTAMHLDAPLGADIQISVVAPDRIDNDADGATSQLNIFLYNVSRNTGYSNSSLPSRDRRGELTSNPVLGLDLYYLLTAYGVSDYHAEILLGGAVQVLHDTPALGRDAIREALTPGPMHPNLPVQLKDARLADQLEYMKIAPLPMPTDEISRIWTSLQTPYRPSVAYQVTTVLMCSQRSTRTALPVSQRKIYVTPFKELRIDGVSAAPGEGTPITTDVLLRVVGSQLSTPDAKVLLNGLDVTAGIVSREPNELKLTLLLPKPPDPPALPDGLHAGVATLQLVQPILMGDPPAPHDGFASNIATFVLVPNIDAVPGVASVNITVSPPVGVNQTVRMLLNQSDAPAGTVPRAYSFPAPPANGIVAPDTETTLINIPISNVVPGNYLVRLQVDGAISVPTAGGGRYDDPVVPL